MIEYQSPEQKLRTAGADVVVIDGGMAGDPRAKKRKPSFQRTSTITIMATVYLPIRWAVPGYVSEGLSILAGRQKLGKTRLAIDWSPLVAALWGSTDCEQGDVLYIDLENGNRRIQHRIELRIASRAATG